MATERTGSGGSSSSKTTNGQARGGNGRDASAATAEEGVRGLAADLSQRAGEMGEGARQVAGEVANRLPAAAATTREAIGMANRQIEAAPTDVLVVGTSLSIGVALGLLLGGSNRLLVATALIPAAAMGATLLERRNREVGV